MWLNALFSRTRSFPKLNLPPYCSRVLERLRSRFPEAEDVPRVKCSKVQVLSFGNGLKAEQKGNLWRCPSLAGRRRLLPAAPDRFLPLKRKRLSGCNAACSSLTTGGLYPDTSVGDVLLKVE